MPHCGTSTRLMTAVGQNEKPSLAVACQLWPAADKPASEPCSVECHVLTHASQKEDHSKMSSARPDSGSGMVMPSARAVFKLMNISTLLACCTGRSAGLLPLRIRPA